MTLDRRLNAYRSDLAHEALEGRIQAERYVAPVPYRIVTPVTDIMSAVDWTRSRDTQALWGEQFDVLDVDGDWAWGQLATDGYVGYVRRDTIEKLEDQPTHIVEARATFLYPDHSIKVGFPEGVSFGSRLRILEQVDQFSQADDATYVISDHIRPLNSAKPPSPDAVIETAMTFLEAPYLWGGRSSAGLDCSALTQFAFSAIGVALPRDSDMQAGHEGFAGPLQPFALDELRAGDLVFWKGHVGLMTSDSELIHCNGHHMRTVCEPIAGAVDRIAELYASPTGYRRPNVFA